MGVLSVKLQHTIHAVKAVETDPTIQNDATTATKKPLRKTTMYMLELETFVRR
jgi:hypothetical protein